MNKSFLGLFALLFFVGNIIIVELVAQTTYYVSESGSDDNIGTSIDAPWETISIINESNFLPGDSILFRKGDTWRETLRLTSSGTPSSYITFSTYGSGSTKPSILGSAKLSDWEQVEGYLNVWVSNTIVPNPFDNYMSEIWFEEKNGDVIWGTHRHRGNSWIDNDHTVLDELVNSEDYKATFIGNSGLGRVYIYSTEDPGLKYKSVECAVRDHVVYLNNKEYISINDLMVRYCLGAHIKEVYGSVPLKGLSITNCEISYSGIKDGANMYGVENRHSDTYIGYNSIHDCGRRSISLVMYDTSPISIQENVVIEHNHLFNGYHTTGVDINNIGQHTIRNITIRNNIIECDPLTILDNENTTVVEGDSRSMGIFIANQGSGPANVGHVDIYGNIFKYMTSRAIAIESTHDINVYNNTFFHFNPTLSGTRAFIYASENANGFELSNITIKNNIFLEDVPSTNEKGLSCIKVDFEDLKDLSVDCNLYYSPDFNDRLIRVNYGPQHYNFFEWEDYQVDLGFDINSPIPSDPLFINSENDNFSLDALSPAVAAGTEVPWDLVDINGNIRDRMNPSLGAVEYSSPNSSAADITSFELDLDVSDITIRHSIHEIDIEVRFGVELINLVPTIGISSGATISPKSGIAQDFTNPIYYTVISNDGNNTETWIVTVVKSAPFKETDILSFNLEGQTGPSIINITNHTIFVEVSNETDLERLSPQITLSTGATITPKMGDFIDFTGPVTYIVTAQDTAINQDWIVTIEKIGINAAPEIILESPEQIYKSTYFQLSAEYSTDNEDDPLEFLWNIPDAFDSSNTDKAVIHLIARSGIQIGNYTFSIEVSDGVNMSTQNITLHLSDINPDAEELFIQSVQVSDEEDGSGADHLFDGDIETRWAAEGDDQWAVLELKEEAYLSHVLFAFYSGIGRKAFFDVFVSIDNEEYIPMILDGESCGFTDAFQGFVFSELGMSSRLYKYVKIVGHMNDFNAWNSFNEIRVFGTLNESDTITSIVSGLFHKDIKIYPNPSLGDFFIEMEIDGLLCIFDSFGRLVLEKQLQLGQTQVNSGLTSGIYFIKIYSINGEEITSKLVIR